MKYNLAWLSNWIEYHPWLSVDQHPFAALQFDSRRSHDPLESLSPVNRDVTADPGDGGGSTVEFTVMPRPVAIPPLRIGIKGLWRPGRWVDSVCRQSAQYVLDSLKQMKGNG